MESLSLGTLRWNYVGNQKQYNLLTKHKFVDFLAHYNPIKDVGKTNGSTHLQLLVIAKNHQKNIKKEELLSRTTPLLSIFITLFS